MKFGDASAPPDPMKVMRKRIARARAALDELENATSLGEMEPHWDELSDWVEQAVVSYAFNPAAKKPE